MFVLRYIDFYKTVQVIKEGPVIPSLLSKDQVPLDLQEVAILRGYRHPKSSILECAISVFIASNETLNFWTHFIPVWYFIWKFFNESLIAHHAFNDPYNWPFITYMITVCLYPLISALAHAFHCTSRLARQIWFFLDYSALSMYSFGSAVLYRAYVFPANIKNTLFADFYLYLAFFISIFCTLAACTSRFTQNHTLKKILRLVSFGIPYWWTATPLLYRVFACSPDFDSLCSVESRDHYILQFVFCFFAAFMYGSHLPERLAPGKFDIIGHSHQFLHICGVLGTNEQMNGAILDYNFGDKQALPIVWSIFIPLFLLLTNLTIILSFTYYAIINGKPKKN